MLDMLLSGAYEPAILAVELFTLLVIIFAAFPFHECAHALTAKLLGDDTAEKQGRLTLNPLVHLDLFGTLAMLLFGIGWAKPVPVNVSRCRKIKNKKAAMAITAAAGPLSNILLSFIIMIVYKVVLNLSSVPITEAVTTFDGSYFANMTAVYVVFALQLVVQLNLYLAVFNLIPIPPFDGSRLLLAFLPEKLYFGIMRYEKFIMLGILLLLYTGILSIPLQIASNWLYGGLDFLTGFVDIIFGG